MKAFFTDLQEISLQVRTPAAALSSSIWLLVGWIQGEVVGWGEDKLGIDVVQMRSVAVIYPASPDTRSQLVVRPMTFRRTNFAPSNRRRAQPASRSFGGCGYATSCHRGGSSSY